MQVTHEQALTAVKWVIDLVDEVWPEGERPTAAQIVLHPKRGEEMRKLVEEIRNDNQKGQRQC
jgi:hypothetical protein